MRFALAVLCGVTALSHAVAQEGAIIAERPGFSTSAQTLDRGRFQIEAGLLGNFDPNFGQAPLALFRAGIGANTELQIGWSGISFDDNETFVSGVSLSVKHSFLEGDGLSPAVGVIGTLIVPSDDDVASQVDGTAGVLWSNSLTPTVGLFGTATIGSTSFGDDRFLQFTNAVGVSFTVSEQGGIFLEHFIQLTEDPLPTVQFIDGGYTHLLSENLQIDFTGGFSISDADAGEFLSIGVAARF